MIFDVKMGKTFRRKTRFVADGPKTKIPSEITYSLAVSRDSVCISLTISALNDLDVLTCDIQNAYLMAYCREWVLVIARADFGSEAGKIMLMRKSQNDGTTK